MPGIWISVNSNAISEREFEDRDRFVSVHRLERRKSGVLHHIDRAQAQQHFVFDDENDTRNDEVIQHPHDGSPQSERRERGRSFSHRTL